MKDKEATKKAYSVADKLHSASIRLLRRVRRNDETMGLGPAALSALSVLVFGGAMSLKKLAEYEQVKPPTMFRIVDTLEKLGLVLKKVDTSDRRGVLLSASAQGKKLMLKGKHQRVSAISKGLEALSHEEMEILERAASLIQTLNV